MSEETLNDGPREQAKQVHFIIETSKRKTLRCIQLRGDTNTILSNKVRFLHLQLRIEKLDEAIRAVRKECLWFLLISQ